MNDAEYMERFQKDEQQSKHEKTTSNDHLPSFSCAMGPHAFLLGFFCSPVVDLIRSMIEFHAVNRQKSKHGSPVSADAGRGAAAHAHFIVCLNPVLHFCWHGPHRVWSRVLLVKVAFRRILDSSAII